MEYTIEISSKEHVAVNIKNTEILAIEYRDEKLLDRYTIKNLVKAVLRNYDSNIYSILGDGSCESNENFRYWKEKELRQLLK